MIKIQYYIFRYVHRRRPEPASNKFLPPKKPSRDTTARPLSLLAPVSSPGSPGSPQESWRRFRFKFLPGSLDIGWGLDSGIRPTKGYRGCLGLDCRRWLQIYDILLANGIEDVHVEIRECNRLHCEDVQTPSRLPSVSPYAPQMPLTSRELLDFSSPTLPAPTSSIY
jgi:hypothetical protein